MDVLTAAEQRSLADELSHAEQILWAGKPNRRVFFHASDYVQVPFSLLWAGFSIFWEAGVNGHGVAADKHPSIFMELWGIPFILFGQYLVWGRFLYAFWRKGRLAYVLTNERLLTLVMPPRAKMISIYLRSVPGITKEIRSDGIGTLKFGETPPLWSSGRSARTASAEGLFLNSGTPVFVDIDDAANVAAEIARALSNAVTSTSSRS